MKKVLLALLCAGCTACAVGPDFRRPAPPEVSGYTPPSSETSIEAQRVQQLVRQRLVEGADLPAQWWALFESALLNRLVERALRANPNVDAAVAALRVARENTLAQQGVFFPSVQAIYTPSRQKTSDALTSPLNSGSSLFTLHTAQVNVSYVADAFGGNRRQVEALVAQEDAQRFQLEATYLTLTSNVVLGAIQEASLHEQIEAAEAIQTLQQETLRLLRKQLELGAIAQAAVVAQEAALAQTMATLPPLKKQLALQRDALLALAGALHDRELPERFRLSELRLPQDLPLSLPSRLVEHRPDVRAAEAQLHAASAQVCVATSNMLPQINLTGNWGGSATRFADMFDPANTFWTLTAAITQPIFQGGTLLHRKRAAEAAFDQASAQYRATVITAFQNVADALHALRYDAETLEATQVAEQAALKSLNIARRQLELGDISYLALLSSELAYRQALINRIQSQASRYADTVALFQALGGGWWNQAAH